MSFPNFATNAGTDMNVPQLWHLNLFAYLPASIMFPLFLVSSCAESPQRGQANDIESLWRLILLLFGVSGNRSSSTSCTVHVISSLNSCEVAGTSPSSMPPKALKSNIPFPFAFSILTYVFAAHSGRRCKLSDYSGEKQGTPLEKSAAGSRDQP